MRKTELSRKPSLIVCCGVLIGISLWAVISFGTLAADCLSDAIAHDVTTIETPRGRMEIEVCVTRDSASGTDTYRYWVKNIDIPCPITGFSVPRAGYSASELESRWHWEGNEEPGGWLWFGGHKRGIQRGTRAEFALHIPGETSPETSDCSVWTAVASPCLGEEFSFQTLAPNGAAGAVFAQVPDSMFCCDSCLSGKKVFSRASSIQVPAGFRAEYFMKTTGLNLPSDVVAWEDGTVVTTSTRSREVYRVSMDGQLSLFAESFAYSIDIGPDGELYGYDMNTGIYRIEEGGEAELIVPMEYSPFESSLAVAPDGAMYVAYNTTSGGPEGLWSTIHVVPPGADTSTQLIPRQRQTEIMAVDVTSDGTLYATKTNWTLRGTTLNRVDRGTGQMTPVAQLPAFPSYHGLAVTDDHYAYISTGDFDFSGEVYQVSPDGVVTHLASVSENGLEGLCVMPDGRIVGAQRVISGLQTVHPNGSIEALVEPAGLVTPQSLALSPCGELVVLNEDGGHMAVITLDARVVNRMQMISFQPPQTHIAFSPGGWYVTGESAPGGSSMVNLYQPNGQHRKLAGSMDYPSGVAVASDGTIFVSGTGDGEIVRFLSPRYSSRNVLIDGLRNPQALAIDRTGKLYVLVGGEYAGRIPPTHGDEILTVSPSGAISQFAKIDEPCSDLAFGPDGALYVPTIKWVLRVWPDGHFERFATGFDEARGVAFDVAGNLYVSDSVGNKIVRITGFPQTALTGTVVDADGDESLGAAYVQIVQAHPPFAGRMAATDENGTFTLSVAPDRYDITAWSEGYETTTQKNIEVEDEPVRITLLLRQDTE